ncbi:MAG: GTPase Era [Rhizobiales bacterium]|nr:GTPase Era [Hyphomicrobiales bacterium]
MSDDLETPPIADMRCGFVAVIGAPNAGKSTLINYMVGSKVAIVSHKVQTTRSTLRGIAIFGNSQVIFIDTPGIFAPKRRLDRAMVKQAWSGAGDADFVMLLVDARKGVDDETRAIVEGLSELKRDIFLILNKIDLVERESLLKLTEELSGMYEFKDVFMISALKGDGVDDLKKHLEENSQPGPWHYPPDQISDAPKYFIAAEITREKLFLRLHDELPYASTVETETWEDKADGSIRIEQVIFVIRDSQKPIVIGKNGQTIRAIGSDARAELSEIFGCKVHLFLFVKVRSKWGDDPARYRAMGLDFPRE